MAKHITQDQYSVGWKWGRLGVLAGAVQKTLGDGFRYTNYRDYSFLMDQTA